MIAEAQALVPVPARVGQGLQQGLAEKILAAHKDVQFSRLTKEEKDAFRAASQPVERKYVELTGPKGAEYLEKIKAKVAEMSR